MAHAREYHSATLLKNDHVIVAGGFDGDYVGTAELYDPISSTWLPAKSPSTARRLHTATLLNDGTVLVAGGGGASGYLKSAELYSAATDTWAPVGSMADARAGHTATVTKDARVLVVGGVNATATLATAEVYDVNAHAWSAVSAIIAARVRHVAVKLHDGDILIAGGTSGSYLNSAELWDADLDNDGLPDRWEVAVGCPGFDYIGYRGRYAQNTKPCNPDSDGDGCKDGAEAGLDHLVGGQRDPSDPWDVFDVPVPALLPGAAAGARNKFITLADVLADLAYVGTSAAHPVTRYGSDLNGNGIPDGQEYDRAPSATPGQPWRSGPPNGFVTLGDVLVVLAQVGTNCS